MIHPFLQDKLPQIISILLKNRVQKAFLFGSACTENFTDASDVDILIRFPQGIDALTIGDLWWNAYFSLEDLLKRPIDLLAEKSLQNPFKGRNQEKHDGNNMKYSAFDT